VTGEQHPRICQVPEYVSSSGRDAVELAAMAGLILDPWQQFVLVNAFGERADGKWAAPTVGLVVGRQNGKNAVLEARELAGLFLLDEQTIIHSAHEQATSSEHFRRLVERIEAVPDFERRVMKVSQGKGAEAIELRNGQRILFKTRTGGGGRGFSIDLIVYDEAMILAAAAKAALVPTLAARSMEGNTQTWYAGSAVDQMNPKHDGVELARIREQGIAGRANIAYFEWSVPGDSPDMVTEEVASDERMQALANPGMGIRISREWIEHERAVELGAREFAVERLGVGDWPATSGVNQTVLDIAAWRALVDRESKIMSDVCFAFDVTPDRSRACIAAAGKRADGHWHLEIVDHRSGTGWLISRLEELDRKHRPSAVMYDKIGPSAALGADLEESQVRAATVSGGEYAQACGRLVDHVAQATVRHLGTAELEQAIRAAGTRPLGDSWAWSRKQSSADISPLVAVTLALWAAETEMSTGDVMYDFSRFATA
jgi:hypothetical protein